MYPLWCPGDGEEVDPAVLWLLYINLPDGVPQTPLSVPLPSPYSGGTCPGSPGLTSATSYVLIVKGNSGALSLTSWTITNTLNCVTCRKATKSSPGEGAALQCPHHPSSSPMPPSLTLLLHQFTQSLFSLSFNRHGWHQQCSGLWAPVLGGTQTIKAKLNHISECGSVCVW